MFPDFDNQITTVIHKIKCSQKCQLVENQWQLTNGNRLLIIWKPYYFRILYAKQIIDSSLADCSKRILLIKEPIITSVERAPPRGVTSFVKLDGSPSSFKVEKFA